MLLLGYLHLNYIYKQRFGKNVVVYQYLGTHEIPFIFYLLF